MKKKTVKVAVLMGGKTPEHEISLISGREVAKALKERGYRVYPIVISRDGSSWRRVLVSKLLSLPDPLSLKNTKRELVTKDYLEIDNPQKLSKVVDVAFIAMHGPFGEDGAIQGVMEMVGIPYTGSGILANALGMNKLFFRKILDSENLPYPSFVSVVRGEKLPSFKKLGKGPFFVKPNSQGSSVGASLVEKPAELFQAIALAHRYGPIALVDKYIKGIEVTCAVMGNDNPEALPLVEIVPKNEFFDYESKYASKDTQEIVPARVFKSLTKKVQDMATKVYKLVGAQGFSRIDFIIDNNKPFILEINTIPGLTPMSLFPKAAQAAGISYPELIEKLVKYALEKSH